RQGLIGSWKVDVRCWVFVVQCFSAVWFQLQQKSPLSSRVWRRGPGRGGACEKMPLSSVLSPLLRRGDRRQKRAPKIRVHPRLSAVGQNQLRRSRAQRP